MVSLQSPRIDWGSLLVRLTPVAKKLFRQAGYDPNRDLPGTSVSVDDLIAGAAIEFFEWVERGKWKPRSADEDPFPLILKTMRRNFIDIVRSPGYRMGKVSDSTTAEDDDNAFAQLPASDIALDKLVSKPTVGFADAEARLLAEAFYPYAEGDQELIDFIDAVVYCQCRKRVEIAEWLDITPAQVTDRQEKLRYNYTRHR